VVCLSLHRPQLGVLQHHPVDHLVVLFRAAGVAEFVVFLVVLLDEVDEDAGAFEEADALFLAVGCGNNVGDGGDATWSDL